MYEIKFSHDKINGGLDIAVEKTSKHESTKIKWMEKIKVSVTSEGTSSKLHVNEVSE